MKRRFQTLATVACLILTLFSIIVFSACSSPCEHDWVEKSVITPAGCTTDGQKQLECTKCQETKTEAIPATGHTGGSATCTDKAICENCDTEYGELNAEIHSGTATWTKTADKHTKKYSCCNAVVVAEENHEFTNGVCSECEYACQHTGGTATCNEKATCTVCGVKYGELDLTAHTGGTATCNEKATCTVCGVKYGELDLTAHTGGTATCNEKATCTVCGVKYGELDLTAHTGGTATCTEKATCTVCQQKYGNVNASNHTGEATWTKTATNHLKKYSCCDATVVADETHEWADGVCSECEYACTHTGGTATCTDKATCSVCGEEYGELDADNHTEEATWTKTVTNHVKKYSCCNTDAVAEADHEFDNGVCTECGYERQNTIDFEGDIVIGSEYYTGENIANINNNIHILKVNEDNTFTLYSAQVGGSGIISFLEKSGTAEYNSETGIYTLIHKNKSKQYGRLKDSLFEFCNKDGSPIETVNKRKGDGVTEVDITVRKGNNDYGYIDLAKNKNGKAMQTLYRDLLKIYEDFYGSDIDIEKKNGEYVLSTVDLNKYGITAEEAISVWKIFGLENPAYYYFYNTLTISDGYMILCLDEDYALASERAKYEADILDMIEECGALLNSNMSELHKVMAIHDYIVKKINYAYEEDGVTPEDAAWAHNIVGVSTVGEGVCEAYAKSFQLLCRYYGIEALTLSGYGGELHAWNLAKVEGKWYCFDLTWNDTGDNNKLSYDCFGLCYANMNASRTHDMPSSFGVDYLYDIPAVSNMDIQLCTLYKDGESLGFCMGIDHAFSLMDDKDAEYEIVLFDYNYTGPLLVSNAMIKHYIYTDNTPDVKKISISGSYKQSDSGYVTLTALYCLNTNGFTIDTDFSIEDMEFVTVCSSFPGIYIDDVSLTFSGSNCESEVPFIGKLSEDNTESQIIVDADIVTIYSCVDVNRIICTEEKVECQANLYLRNNSKADYIRVPVLQLDGETVSIGEFKTIGVHSHIGLNCCKLTLGDISFSENTEELMLGIRFGNLEELSDIKITGEVDASTTIVVRIDGEITHQTTDMDGNVLDEWVEKADPFDIEESFLHLNENVSFENMSFEFIEQTGNGGYSINMTYAYTMDSEYNVMSKDITETEDGFVISGDTLIKYRGDSATPTIPSGIRVIGHQAFFNSSVTELVIPEGVEILGDYIFQLCESVESLSLPSTLTAIGERAINITGTVSYNGTRLEWNCLVSKMNPEFVVKSVSCTDGMSMRNGFFYEDYEYTEFYCGSQEFTHGVTYMEYVKGEFKETEGNANSRFLLTKVGEGMYDISQYTVYGENNSLASVVCVASGLEGVYSEEADIYTLTTDNATYYIKITGDVFAFCDENGEKTTSSHPSFNIYF